MKNQLQHKEWQNGKKWNPFNSLKLLGHVDRWRLIRNGDAIPPPVLITIDPSSACNYECPWCNSKPVIGERAKHLSKTAMTTIAATLQQWGDSSSYGVEAVCIAGGGEPLLNSNTGYLIEKLVTSGIDVGVVTNGSLIHKFISSLSMCHWVSVSIDAGTSKTFSKMKNAPSRHFTKILRNIETLVAYSKRNASYLASAPLSFGVTYKFLMYEDNIGEIATAAKLAKEIGCKSIHIRPAGTPWYRSSKEEGIKFEQHQMEIFREQIAMAQLLDDDTFSVYGVTHKFDHEFQALNDFAKCYAIFMTAVFMPPYKDDDPHSFVIALCCDKRGNIQVELARNVADVNTVVSRWGSQAHWAIHDAIAIETCPRCTYSPNNEIFQKVILQDNMSINFI